MSNIIEFKLKSPSKDASSKELDETLNLLEQVQTRLTALRTELMDLWLKAKVREKKE